MGPKGTKTSTPTPATDRTADLLRQYGCGPIRFAGTDNGFYERHLVFDNVADTADTGPRERYEAVARSVRDVLSQRWVRRASLREFKARDKSTSRNPCGGGRM